MNCWFHMASRSSGRRIAVLGTILTLFGVATSQGSHRNDHEHKLLKHLFENYSKEARPVMNKSQAIEVQFDLAYSQLIYLDSKNQILSSKVWLRQMWNNPFLKWNPDNYGGIEAINIDPSLIWRPDIILYNNIGFGETGAIYNFDTKAVLKYTGYTEWFAPTEIHSICKIDITYFPFDEQKCPLVFGSWTYTGNKLNLTNTRDAADLSKYTVSGEWELIDATLNRHEVTYSCCPHPFIDITYTIQVKRRVLFYMMNLIIPCIVLAVLTVFSFYLPPESGERMGLVITILLGLTVFMMVFTDNVPRTSEVTPLIGKYSVTVLVQVTVALLVTCSILRVYHRDPERNMPNWFRKLVFDILGPMLLALPSEERTKLQQEDKNRNFYASKVQGAPYEVHHSQNHLIVSLPKLISPKKGDGEMGSKCFHTSLGSNLSLTPADERMEEIACGMRTIVAHLKDAQDSDAKVNDWHHAAAVLDIAFFWITAITILGSTLAFYFMIPN